MKLPHEMPAAEHVMHRAQNSHAQSSYDGNSRNSILAVVNNDLQDRMQRRIGMTERTTERTYRTNASGQMYGSRSSFMSQADAMAQHLLNSNNVGFVRRVQSMPVSAHTGVPSASMTNTFSVPRPMSSTITSPLLSTVISPMFSTVTSAKSPMSTTPAPPPPFLPAARMAVESRVLVHSLEMRLELNQKLGTVTSFLPNGRIGVLLDCDQEAIQAFKPENLRLVLSDNLQYKATDAHGIPTATSQVCLPT